MISTYSVAEYQESDKTVEVIYYDENEFEHKRTVNIPHLEDGSIDEQYFQEILEGQLRGVQKKATMGMITFTDPLAEVGITTD